MKNQRPHIVSIFKTFNWNGNKDWIGPFEDWEKEFQRPTKRKKKSSYNLTGQQRVISLRNTKQQNSKSKQNKIGTEQSDHTMNVVWIKIKIRSKPKYW